jgi:hypothetical protein
MFNILCEVGALVRDYSTLLMIDFLNGVMPPIGIVPNVPQGIVPYHHAQVALTKLIERIQNPGPNLLTINSLPNGCYVTDICIRYANADVQIAIYKNS